jgi:REP element-mobilizing transposase RayT
MLIYRRKLPHIHNEGHPIFLTWRLHGSVPVCKQDAILKSDPRPGHAFVAADRTLDRDKSGPHWLGDIRIASLVSESIKAGETARGFYELHAWVIMPNHVHLLITPRVPLPEVTRWLKCSTGYKANQILGLTGHPFWRQESWDRWVRDTAEFKKIIRYIERNPVSAGFVDRVELWRWSSGYRAGASAYPT